MVNQGDETIDAFQHFTATAIIPPKQSFGEFMYNPKTKTVMGRTADSWSKYIFFFSFKKTLRYSSKKKNAPADGGAILETD